MNSNSFDFNINNYSITDLENYLNLDDGYDDDDINNKVKEFSKKIINISDISFKNKLTKFIIEVKNTLLNNNDDKNINNIDELNPNTPKNNIISAGSTYVIDNRTSKNVSNNVQQIYATDIAKGTVTTLKKNLL